MKVYMGDIGTEIVVDCGVDVSAAATPALKVKKPDSSTATWPATVVESNKLRHITVAGDLDQAGKYLIQPDVNLPTWDGLGETVELTVYPAFA